MRKLPIIGYSLQVINQMVLLPKSIVALKDTIQETKATSKMLQSMDADIKKRLLKSDNLQAELLSRQAYFDERIVEMAKKIASRNLVSAHKPNNETSHLMADNHENDVFYVNFENQFRGAEEEITERLKVYIPYFKATGLNFSKHPVLDIGCGRGEMLALLKQNSINCTGLDLNEAMVEECVNKGLSAIQADAFSFLAKSKSSSLGAITGFHIAEHIPFDRLLDLLSECYRVLSPGGIIIFETPNPESIHVGSLSFYYDPSHLNPIVPDVFSFASKTRGFSPVEILRLHPKNADYTTKSYEDPAIQEITRRFFMEQDYSIIGYKPSAQKFKP